MFVFVLATASVALKSIISGDLSNWGREVVPELSSFYGENVLTKSSLSETNFTVPPDTDLVPRPESLFLWMNSIRGGGAKPLRHL